MKIAPEGKRRTSLYLTDEVLAALERLRRARGYRSLSATIRMLVAEQFMSRPAFGPRLKPEKDEGSGPVEA
jgi:hypothetical protein